MTDFNDLTKWINLEQLQELQDSLHSMTGMPVVTVDLNGRPLTRPSGHVIYCDDLAHRSPRCDMLCAECRNYGAREAGKLGTGAMYACHMGLLECSAPIKIHDNLVACLVSGHVFEQAPTREKTAVYAARYGLDPEELWEAARQVPVRSMTEILEMTRSLYALAHLVAENATCRIEKEQALIEMKRASQLKDDFLANMSHEIRTPMNSVIGLTDIAMQEDMPEHVRDYLEQIKSSGNSLLHIINDILDYSKISSGKMDIFEEEYKPALVIRDVATIITSRLRGKSDNVELFIDIDPNLPETLIGDASRIQQILINLANNAIKFTNEGFIRIRLQYTKIGPETARLNFRIEDTGIGIRREDQDKLFKSFSQVNSRRNREIEGTGLGLAIVKQLVDLMDGRVRVESEYGKGSMFFVELPQKLATAEPLVRCEHSSLFECIGFFQNPLMGRHFELNLDSINVHAILRQPHEVNTTALEKWLAEYQDKQCYLFLDEIYASDVFLELLTGLLPSHPNLRVVLVLDAYADDRPWKNRPGLLFLHKPFHVVSLAMLLEKDPIFARIPVVKTKQPDVNFKAPTARVLVVDDVPMNLKVATRLIERFGITAEGVGSGQEALDRIVCENYDLIFMDHMMPGLDGVDTTRLIRRFHPKFNGIPIIALTANVMGDARKLFLDEGMNDMLSKPINPKDLRRILHRWLPPNKIEIINE